MRGATDADLKYAKARQISIHAPHAGSDVGSASLVAETIDFNPRSPCGERLFQI